VSKTILEEYREEVTNDMTAKAMEKAYGNCIDDHLCDVCEAIYDVQEESSETLINVLNTFKLNGEITDLMQEIYNKGLEKGISESVEAFIKEVPREFVAKYYSKEIIGIYCDTDHQEECLDTNEDVDELAAVKQDMVEMDELLMDIVETQEGLSKKLKKLSRKVKKNSRDIEGLEELVSD